MPELGDLTAALDSGDSSRAEAAVRRLAESGPEDSLQALEELLHRPNSETRWWAARALAELDEPRAAELLVSALQDRDPAVQQCAALGLRLRPLPGAIPALVDLLHAPQPLSARLAADALIAAGANATEALILVLENAQGTAQVEAARALAHIGDRRAIGPLFQALESGSALVEHWASEGLDRMGLGMRFFSPNS